MKVRLVISPHRPFGDMTHQRAPAHIEGRDLHAVTFGLGWIDQSAACISDKIGFPVDESADLFTLICRNKIVFLGIENFSKRRTAVVSPAAVRCRHEQKLR